jgi:hypothetical protein
MSQLMRAMGLGILGIALVVGVGISGDTKKDKDKDPPKKGNLPPGWKGLMLSKEQRDKLGTVMSEYKSKIVALEKQIDELKSAEKVEMYRVLNEDQKGILLKGLTGDDKDKKDDKDKDKKDGKDKDKDK